MTDSGGRPGARCDEGTRRILAPGDSFTYGAGVPFENTFLALLEQRLNERPGSHPRVEIISVPFLDVLPDVDAGLPRVSAIHPVILCGGGGTRLWPLSRTDHPKPLLALGGPGTLLEDTVERVAAEGFAAPTLVCSERHRFLVERQLRGLGREPAAILVEPVGRDTAPAAAVAAWQVAALDPEALLLLLPSDHVVLDPAGFRAAVATAAVAARAGEIVTFGVRPDRPETGYGYIELGDALAGAPGCQRVARFLEKPDAETAQRFVAGGRHTWNSGMFLVSASVLLEELARLAPEVHRGSKVALAEARREGGLLHLGEEAFAGCPAISFDRAVMEKTKSAAVVPIEIGWSDVGSWDSLWQSDVSDAEGNVTRGDVVALDTTGSLLHSPGALLTTIGVQDLVVVVTTDAVLVCPRDRSQDVRGLAERLASEERSEARHHRQVHRPWGSYESLASGPNYQVKRLRLEPGASISLQRHARRSEHWVVVKGLAEVTRGEDTLRLRPNQSTGIPVGTIHRLHNPGPKPLILIEVQCGDYLGEDDIERLEDLYGRAGPDTP